MSNVSSCLIAYDTVNEDIAALDLPFSCSELHGQMCGFITTGSIMEGENYLQGLIESTTCAKKEKQTAARALFELYNTSHQQILEINFEFDLLLPNDDFSLIERTQAFSDWCSGFLMAIKLAKLPIISLDPEVQESLEHIREFAELDCEDLDADEDNEKALTEIHEYVRIVVLRLSGDLQYPEARSDTDSTRH